MDKSPFQTSGKQPDPQPPLGVTPQAHPSILLYLVLTAIAVALIAAAFALNKADWPGLFLGLATNIIAAVVLLILIDRRLRYSELAAIRKYAAATPMRIAALFSKDISIAIAYSQTLHRELLLIRPKPYFERKDPSIDYLLGAASEGFILCGRAGEGKSALIQALATSQAEKVVRKPRTELIPIILPMREWELTVPQTKSLSELLWKKMSAYTDITRDRFDRWLARKRLLIILDGLDEVASTDLQVARKEILNFRGSHRDIPVIISTRELNIDWAGFGLPRIEIPRLTAEETKELEDLILRSQAPQDRTTS